MKRQGLLRNALRAQDKHRKHRVRTRQCDFKGEVRNAAESL